MKLQNYDVSRVAVLILNKTEINLLKTNIMAEIKIEKKKPIWPWILLVAVILALLYFFFLNNDNDDVDDVSDNDIEMVTDDVNVQTDNSIDDNTIMLSERAASKISEYTTYISDESKMGIDHEYSNGALLELIDATEAVANSWDVNIDADLEEARANATSVLEDPLEVDHADKIRNSGSIIAMAIAKIQVQKFPNMNDSAAELQNSVMDIVPGTKTLEQKEAVKRFFDQAGEILMNMKNR